ncbi:MAG: energy-coupling factor transporter transmembrane protein EcfT [Chloroflexi bacterium]|nr:energy-coupling factor transporter transmembrane protein EcfT [Chloroflexota bacterium]
MLVTWKYRPRDTFIQRLDPRTRIIMLACMVVAFTVFWDLRVVLPLAALSFALFGLARIEWRDVKRAVLFISAFAIILVIVNAILGARGAPPSVRADVSPVVWQSPEIVIGSWHWAFRITAARIMFMISQLLRFLGMAFMAIPIPYTLDPELYGATFRQLGVPDKPSYSIDLAFRLVPTLARDFGITIDAQRARGYELDKVKGGLFERIRRLAPIIVPVVIQSIVDGEEIIDAMELRGFGVGKRTWTRHLHYRPVDYAIIAVGLVFAVVCTLMGLLQIAADVWLPPLLLSLAG